MWEHYKRTFVGIQAVIVVVSGGVLALTHSGWAALLFFVTMQVGSLSGAMWAQRLKHKVAVQALRSRRT